MSSESNMIGLIYSSYLKTIGLASSHGQKRNALNGQTITNISIDPQLRQINLFVLSPLPINLHPNFIYSNIYY